MSRIFTFITATGVLLVLLGVAGTRAEADTIYTVDRSVGNPFLVTVTGELITDGTLGALESSNFVDWHLTIESFIGSEALLGDLSGFNSLLVVAGDSLTATPDGLFFDFSEFGFLWVTNGGAPHAGSYWCLDNNLGLCNVFSGETIGSKSTAEGFRGWQGIHQIATVKPSADVPEPASLLLLGIGTLGVLRRRRGLV